MDIKQLFPTNPTSGATMTEQQALLASIITSPDDDTPRSMYADFLQDSDTLLDRKLGGYIKISLELSNHKLIACVYKDDKLKEPNYDGEGNKVDSYKWYQRGIELNNQKTILWNYLIEKNWLGYLWQSVSSWKEDRGFISSITCTASQLLSVCDKLIWHPSMETTCPVCGGHVQYLPAGRDYGGPVSPFETCYQCTKGKVARPCPLTAHPVREVEITDIPHVMRELSTIHKWATKYGPLYGIKFTYPPTAT